MMGKAGNHIFLEYDSPSSIFFFTPVVITPLFLYILNFCLPHVGIVTEF